MPSGRGASPDQDLAVVNTMFITPAEVPVLGINEIITEKPMIEQFVERFGDYEKTWRDDNLDGGVDIYVWKSDTRFVSFAIFDDKSGKLYIRSNDSPQLYPPKTPKTSILGIDPPASSLFPVAHANAATKPLIESLEQLQLRR